MQIIIVIVKQINFIWYSWDIIDLTSLEHDILLLYWLLNSFTFIGKFISTFLMTYVFFFNFVDWL